MTTTIEMSSASALVSCLRDWGYELNDLGSHEQIHKQKEAWYMKRYVLALAEADLLSFQLTISHNDSPDFVWTDNIGNTTAIEVTESTHQRDKRELVTGQQNNVSYLLGAYGGRGNGGYAGEDTERLNCADIVRAIRRKKKTYGHPTRLLLNANSNAVCIPDIDDLRRLLADAAKKRDQLRKPCSVVICDYLLHDAMTSPQVLCIPSPRLRGDG